MDTYTIELLHLRSKNIVEEAVVGWQDPEDQEVCCEIVSLGNDWEATSVIIQQCGYLNKT